MKDVAYAQYSGFARDDLDKELVARHWFSLNEAHLWDIVNETNKHSIDKIVHNIVVIYVSGLYKH